jgi:maltose phosphorylase
VLQGIFLFEDDFDNETITRNFDFYESRTVHESSLSPCIHAIIASKIGRDVKAYEMYVRTARLDLDDYNHEADEGLHITSMAGTWMSVVYGFGGMRIKNGILHFNPNLPEGWKSFSFKIEYRGSILNIKISKKASEISSIAKDEIEIYYNEKQHKLEPNKTLVLSH